MKTNSKNTIQEYLSLLKVKFTKKFLEQIHYIYPFKDTLFGISNILSDYKVKTSGVKIKKKEDIKYIDLPFIASISNKYIIVTKVDHSHIWYLMDGKEIKDSLDLFFNLWNGAALIGKATTNSIEPNYKDHKKLEIFESFRNKAIILSLILLSILGIYFNNTYNILGIKSLFLIIANISGVYIGYLLLQKQMHIQNDSADKICSLTKNGGCDKVLNSAASKFMGLISWSEIGLGYFLANLLVLLFFPCLLPCIILINCCALPYSLWSVWHQKFRAKQWCPLCLIVQALLWLLFIINLTLECFTQIIDVSFLKLIFSGCIFALFILSINILSPYLLNKIKLKHILKKYNELRIDDNLFRCQLLKKPHHIVGKDSSSIIWGNQDSQNTITIITNPHCSPCAEMHKRVKELLKKWGHKICIQYIYSSFSEELESSARFLIAVHLSDTIMKETKEQIIDEWFESGKYKKDLFFKKHNLNIETELVIEEYEKHKTWRKTNHILGTPMVLVNGYELPEEYSLEDLRYFLDIKI